MTPLLFESRVGSDGVLKLDVPIGTEHAGQAVRVTVTVAGQGLSAEQWRGRILATAGKWQGELERPEQGDYERREPLS